MEVANGVVDAAVIQFVLSDVFTNPFDIVVVFVAALGGHQEFIWQRHGIDILVEGVIVGENVPR